MLLYKTVKKQNQTLKAECESSVSVWSQRGFLNCPGGGGGGEGGEGRGQWPMTSCGRRRKDPWNKVFGAGAGLSGSVLHWLTLHSWWKRGLGLVLAVLVLLGQKGNLTSEVPAAPLPISGKQVLTRVRQASRDPAGRLKKMPVQGEGLGQAWRVKSPWSV